MDKVTLIIVLTRSLIALIMVCSGVYLLASGVDIPPEAWKVASIVFAALYGADALATAVKAIRSENK